MSTTQKVSFHSKQGAQGAPGSATPKGSPPNVVSSKFPTLG